MPEEKYISLTKFLLQLETIDITLFNYMSRENFNNNEIKSYLIETKNIPKNIVENLILQYNNTTILDISNITQDPDVKDSIPEKIARKFTAISLKKQPEGILTAIKNPFDYIGINQIKASAREPLNIVMGKKEDIEARINLCYRKIEKIQSKIKKFHFNQQKLEQNLPSQKLNEEDIENDANSILENIFQEAIQSKASDIHIELLNSELQIRFRIDGVLEKLQFPFKSVAENLLRKIKILANLDISKNHAPQDGHIVIKNTDSNESTEARVSIMPLGDGFSIVIRLLGTASDYEDISKYIPDYNLQQKISSFLIKKQGSFLVTGPTGSGKTTTLYCIITQANKPGIKIISMEDPVEATIPGINQVQIFPERNLDFEHVLRASLRQDPDIILVGEMRDFTTANIGLRAAITGHLLLSSLHTNNVSSTINRLINLEIDPFLLASSLNIILSQRLIKLICSHCSEPYTPSEVEAEELLKYFNISTDKKNAIFKKGKGCNMCSNSGYKKRTAVYEVFEFSNDEKSLLSSREFTKLETLIEEKMKNEKISDKAIKLALNGHTTISEALGVIN